MDAEGVIGGPVRGERIADVVARRLAQAILSGQLPPGSRLREETLASNFSVSRTPIREALIVLAASGLAHLEPNRGATVLQLTADDVAEVYHLRAVLESESAALASRRITPEVAGLLVKICDRMGELRAAPAAEQLAADTNFHYTIAEASGSPRLVALIRQVSAIPGDVTDPAHRAALARAVEAAGGLDLLVNNAGTLGASPLPALADYPVDELRTAFEVNVIAPVALTQLLLRPLRVRGGAVLNITSDAAVEAYTGWGGYGAAKAALEQASNVLAAEEQTVRVWWADPGDLRTEMHQRAFPGEDISDRPLPSEVAPGFLRLVSERLPSGRYRAAELLS